MPITVSVIHQVSASAMRIWSISTLASMIMAIFTKVLDICSVAASSFGSSSRLAILFQPGSCFVFSRLISR